jgi:hypothetical protein
LGAIFFAAEAFDSWDLHALFISVRRVIFIPRGLEVVYLGCVLIESVVWRSAGEFAPGRSTEEF